jgi:hypothetical protein
MAENLILGENLRAMAARDPALAGRLARIEPRRDILFFMARSGLPVPGRRTGEGRLAFHSTVDPAREGERLSALHPRGGYLVFLGIGGGYHIVPFLRRPEVSRLLVVERDPGLLRAVLERIDLRAVLADPRTLLRIGADPSELRQTLLDSYFPALDGGLGTVTLRSLFEPDSGYYGSVVESIRSTLSRIADDAAVQARFGRRWFLNTLRNLPRAQAPSPALPAARTVLVTGAGPSLEDQVDSLRRMRPEGLLLATDTSLPALLGQGITPDIVLSIDCQQASYHHFLQGLPPETLLVLDLASPPLLARMSSRVLFFASGHPFSRYLSARWKPFLRLDTSGGNVAHAAVSLAGRLGAGEIRLFGLDFSYPAGKSYARGTYLYPLFQADATRQQPLEHRFFSFLYRGPQLLREPVEGGWRYTTRSMLGYRRRLEEALEDLPARVIPMPGRGLPLRTPPRAAGQAFPPGMAEGRAGAEGKQSREAALQDARVRLEGACIPAGGSACVDAETWTSRAGAEEPLRPEGGGTADWREALESYAGELAALPDPQAPLTGYLDRLTGAERALWATLWPAAAALRREAAPPETRSAEELLRRTRAWARIKAHLFLESGSG